MHSNLKFILSIATGVLCVIVIAAGFFVFWQQDLNYRIRMDDLNKSASPGYETIDSHRFGPLLKQYKSPYMGDVSNMGGLFDNLLLVRAGLGIGMDADTYTLRVYYQTTEEELKHANVVVALSYNSVAAFTLVDNLQHIEYYFPGNNFVYTVSRDMVEDWFGTKNLAEYFPDETAWQNNFQEFMKDSGYREDIFQKIFVADYRNSDATDSGAVAATGREANTSRTEQ